MPRLKIQDKSGTHEVSLDERLVVGRVESCDFTVQDESCSRKHCEVVVEDGRWKVRDLASSHGTQVNGARVEEQALEDGDEIRIGATSLRFFLSDADAQARFEAGEHEGDVVPLGAERVTFGRRPDNDRSVKDIKVSGVHLEIVREGDAFVLRDLGSTNGTLLDERKVDEVTLTHGDRVQFGEQVFVFEDLSPGAIPVETAAAGSSAAKGPASTVKGEGRSRARSMVALVLLVGALGGAVWFSFFQSGGESGGGAARKAPDPPAGSLWTDDFSFESAAAVGGSWENRGSASFQSRRGEARTGGSSLSTTLDEESPEAEIVRASVAVSGKSGYQLSGAWSIEGDALVSLTVTYHDDAENPEVAQISQVAAQSTGTDGDWQEISRLLFTPVWADTLSVALTARGAGEVRVDDLVLKASSEQPRSAKVGGGVALLDRGGSYTVSMSRPLVEGFVARGLSVDEEGRSVEASPGRFEVDVQQEEGTLRYRLGARRPESLALFVYPEVAAHGIDLLTDNGGQRTGGAFEVPGVQAVIVGSAAERFELKFSSSCSVSGVPHGEALILRVVPAADELAVTVRAGFEAETRKASDLIVEAQADHRAGRLGDALMKLGIVRDQVPFDVASAQRARELGAQMLREVDERVQELDGKKEGAVFLDSLQRYREVLAEGESLLAEVRGSKISAALDQSLNTIRERVSALEGERHEREAKRLQRIVEAYENFGGRDATAERLRSALESSYGDTRAARGEGGS